MPHAVPSFELREFARPRDGMIHAMDGGLWLHHHAWKGRAMAHLVSTDRELLLAYGRRIGLPAERLQYKPLKDPRTGARREAWHWDLVGRFLPPRTIPPTTSEVGDRGTRHERSSLVPHPSLSAESRELIAES